MSLIEKTNHLWDGDSFVENSEQQNKTMNALTDKDQMPFGKYSKAPDGPRIMEDVPADYLLWLWDEGCSNQGVRHYIINNMSTLLEECPDYIPQDERE